MNPEILDVVIIGAGLSGIGAAVHVRRECPEKNVAILEARGAIGGTWDLFRYPGIRSDSDMYTLGYNFKPWTNPKAIADGPSILEYVRETAAEYGVDRKIRFHHKVVRLDWSSRTARWNLEVVRGDTGETVHLASRFVVCAAGYYKYENGHTPHFEGRDDFRGTVVHPQRWPEGFDYTGKRVVVIGSGATAVTLVPALAEKAAHVTMLQRSPSYVASVPEKDALSNRLREFLPEHLVYRIARARNVTLSMVLYNFTRRFPERARAFLLEAVERQVGPSVDMKHFTPKYAPWDERLCAVPDGDLFKALRDGRASVVTDAIDRFTAKGIRLASGEELEADVIVTATGLEIQLLGGTDVRLDGEPLQVSEKMYYRGAMLEDVPNLALVFGYTNSSWTLKADLIVEYFCKVMNHMSANGFVQATPRTRGMSVGSEPFLNLNSGYVKRAQGKLPKQGLEAPWKLYQNYLRDYALMKFGGIDDGALVFSNPVSHGVGYEIESESTEVPETSVTA